MKNFVDLLWQAFYELYDAACEPLEVIEDLDMASDFNIIFEDR